MTARLPAEHHGASEPLGDYLYYARTPPRRDLPLYCRRHASGQGPEEVLLDLGALADAHGFAGVGAMSISADHSLFAYTVDLVGAEEFELRVVEISSGQLLSSRPNVSNVEWAHGDDLVYTAVDERGRPCAALLHTAGTGNGGRGADALLFEERDESAVVDVALTKSRRWLTVNSNTRTSSEVRLVRADAPTDAVASPRLVAPREPGVTYFVEQLSDDGWLVVIGNTEPPRRALALSAVHEDSLPLPRAEWTPLVPPADDRCPIEDVDVFSRHVVLYERRDGLPRARVLRVQPGSPPSLLDDGIVPLPSVKGVPTDALTPCALTPAPNRDFNSTQLHFHHSSPIAPPTPYAYDMVARALHARGPPSEPPCADTTLVCERHHAIARDGTRIPLTLVRDAAVAPSATTPLHLVVYGAYGASLPCEWRAEHLPLLSRGWVVVLAHVRGGGELGAEWHRAGARLAKRTSAEDVCDSLRWLHESGWSSPARSTAAADSAGALALGGMLNEAPGLLAAAIVRSGFLDPLGAMSDPSLPLAIEEREEWGDPMACDATRAAMLSYSPYDGIRQGVRYPALLVVAAENDARVPFTQSLEYVARVREGSQRVDDAPPAVLLMRASGGHFGDGGRYRRLEQASVELAFLIHSVSRDDSMTT